MHQHVALRWDEEIGVTLTEDGRWLDIDGVVASHSIVEFGGEAYGSDDGPYGVSAGIGTKGDHSPSNEEETAFGLGTTRANTFGEEGVEGGGQVLAVGRMFL